MFCCENITRFTDFAAPISERNRSCENRFLRQATISCLETHINEEQLPLNSPSFQRIFNKIDQMSDHTDTSHQNSSELQNK